MEVVTLRSGKQVQAKEMLDEEKVAEKKENEKDYEPPQLVKEYKPTILYLAKLKKDHIDEQFWKIP